MGFPELASKVAEKSLEAQVRFFHGGPSSFSQLWENTKDKSLEMQVKFFHDPDITKYAADMEAGFTYYTLTYAAQELALGKDIESVVYTRLIGLPTLFLAMKPVAKRRERFAKKWNVTKQSPFKDKLKVNIAAITPVQAVLYAGMLAFGMAVSGNYRWGATAASWAFGTGVGAIHAFPFGTYHDRTLRKYGLKEAIE